MINARLVLALAALLATASAPEAEHPANVVATAPDGGKVASVAETHAEATAAPAVAPSSMPFVRKVVPFAAELAERAAIATPAGWLMDGQGKGWAPLIAATPATRQAARWAYATQQIAQGRGPEAFGALSVMRQDEPDLALVPSFQLALGAALVLLDRPVEALAALATDTLQPNSEACAWRMMALSRGNEGGRALGQVRCALPALNARRLVARRPFLLAAARAALDVGQPAAAEQVLLVIPDSDPAANLLRGRALIALGQRDKAMLALARVGRTGNMQQKIDAELSGIEADAQQGKLAPKVAARLRQMRFTWRGGDVELRALRLSYVLARQAHDLRGTLEAGATIFRYFAGGPDRLKLLAELRETQAETLAPSNPLPLDQVAGLYWDYRDLSPAGADGDLLVTQLADRLQAAALYERGAELLDHQLRTRVRDIAQGPLSARVASLFILAGKPQRALAAVRDTEGNSYPDEMLWARHRVEAVALEQLGRGNEALAVLQDVPDGQAIQGELLWRRRDWKALADAVPPVAAGAAPLTDVAQARILRHAVALAMLGREADLARLRGLYGAAFAKLPSAPAFDALTAAVGAIDPAKISAAMTAIPSASPAGSIGDLIDAAPQLSR